MSEDAMHIIAQKADGAMRDALTLFDQTVAFCGREVTYEQVIKNLNVLDYDYYFSLTDNFLQGDYAQAMLTFDEILSKGFNAQSFIGGLSTHFRDLLVCKSGAAQTLLELAPTVAQRYRDYAARCQTGFLFEALGITSAAEAGYKQSGNPRLLIEFALMKICNLAARSLSPVAQPEVAGGIRSREHFSASGTDTRATEPAAKESPKPKPSGLSLKAMMAEAEKGPATTAKTQTAANQEPQTLTLPDAWKALAESEAKAPRLSSAILQATPTLEGNEILFEVGNAAQKDWIDRNCRLRLESFLQRKLAREDIRLTVTVKKAEETGKGMYMPSDKAKYLQENSPEYNALRKDLELEVS